MDHPAAAPLLSHDTIPLPPPTAAAAAATIDVDDDDPDSSALMMPLIHHQASATPSMMHEMRSRNVKATTAITKATLPSTRIKSSSTSTKPTYRISVMNVMARLLFWATVLGTVAAVLWYSYELKNNGTDPHLIAWFSAGAFVLLGFPISMYGIVMHLANYNEPKVQMYIVRILWMVPIYSMESWLCLRFHRYAIYIETLRDLYESYVLYSFLQFLIQVLGGEEELVLLLKDKSPTRGVHMWGLQWCVRPWLMGQPSRTTTTATTTTTASTSTASSTKHSIQWTSPFFVRCKFGVLQYVLLKFFISIVVMVLELHGLYHEGDFSIKGGYVYICFLTNVSQCWALYCMIFFYYATHNELSPIRPVGKFLSVKALVFFTWWQSVMISIVYQMDMIPHYHSSGEGEWTSEDVAKGLQDYLICIEMFVGAIVHTFVFPHSDYLPAAVAARIKAGQHFPNKNNNGNMRVRLGRKHYHHQSSSPWHHQDGRDDASKDSGTRVEPHEFDLELATTTITTTLRTSSPPPPTNVSEVVHEAVKDCGLFPGSDIDDDDDEPSPPKKPGFVRALLDSSIPRDVIDNSVGIVKGDYLIEKKTLLGHAAAADQYDIFSNRSKKG